MMKRIWFLELRKTLNWYEPSEDGLARGRCLRLVWLNHQHVINYLILIDLQRKYCLKLIYFRDLGWMDQSYLGLASLLAVPLLPRIVKTAHQRKEKTDRLTDTMEGQGSASGLKRRRQAQTLGDGCWRRDPNV